MLSRSCALIVRATVNGCSGLRKKFMGKLISRAQASAGSACPRGLVDGSPRNCQGFGPQPVGRRKGSRHAWRCGRPAGQASCETAVWQLWAACATFNGHEAAAFIKCIRATKTG
jgi:hypothetical protein